MENSEIVRIDRKDLYNKQYEIVSVRDIEENDSDYNDSAIKAIIELISKL